MRIERPTGLTILPCLASIQASHKRTSLYRSKNTTSYQRIGSNPANVARVWPWRETPGWGGWEIAQCSKLLPRIAAIFGAGKSAWLRARIDPAVATDLLF